MLNNFKDCTALQFLELFELHKTNPNEHAEPMWFFIRKAATVLETEYFRTRKQYFSVLQAAADTEFVDAIKQFQNEHTGPIWEVYANVFPINGTYPTSLEPAISHFIEITCPFFGIFFQKVSVREHKKLKRLNPDDEEIPKPGSGANKKTRSFKKPKLYSLEKVKNQNVKVLGEFMHSVHRHDAMLLPETYSYRKYFLPLQKEASN